MLCIHKSLFFFFTDGDFVFQEEHLRQDLSLSLIISEGINVEAKIEMKF